MSRTVSLNEAHSLRKHLVHATMSQRDGKKKSEERNDKRTYKINKKRPLNSSLSSKRTARNAESDKKKE
jgi:hypothetical protein